MALSVVRQYAGCRAGEDNVDVTATEHSRSVLVGGKWKREAMLKVCNDLWLPSRLEQCTSYPCNTRKRAVQDASFRMLGYDAFWSRSSVVNGITLSRKKEQIGRAWEAFPRKIADDEEYYTSRKSTCGNMEWL